MSKYYEEAVAAIAAMDVAADFLDKELREANLAVTKHIAKTMPSQQSSFSEWEESGSSTKALPAWVKRANAMAIQAKHIEWGRKIHSIVMGYVQEMQSAHQSLVKERNSIGFKKADVTVGTDEMYAKAIQHKHTVSTENSSVNEMIAKAANQLTGESGETPLTTQHRVIDVMISDQHNWWPFDNKDFNDLLPEANIDSGIIPLSKLKSRAAKQITTQLAKYKKGASGLNKKAINSLHYTMGGAPKFDPFALGPKSSARFIGGEKAEVITIKIRYKHTRRFLDRNIVIALNKIVFIAYLDDGNLKVDYLQHS